MRRDDLKFLAAMAATAVLAGGVVYSTHRAELRLSAGPTVDIERIESLMQQGLVSDHEASWWEPATGEVP
jgi:hypothetical protein